MSLRPEFNEDPGWDPIDEQKVYSPEEMAAFEKARKEYIEEMIRQGKVCMYMYKFHIESFILNYQLRYRSNLLTRIQ